MMTLVRKLWAGVKMDNNPYSGQQASSETSANTPVGQEGTTVSVPGGNVVADNPVLGDHPSQRILGRQIPSSASRGTQTMTGQTIVNDPATNKPVISTSAIKQNTIFSDPTTQTPRVIEGLLPDNNYGMWVSKPGIDATKATLDQLIFNSNQDILKIVQSDTFSFEFSADPISTGKIAHNLGFAPMVSAFLNQVVDPALSDSSFNLPLPTWVSVSIDTTAQVVSFGAYLFAFTDTKYVYFTLFNSFGLPATLPITYYLLQETATAPTATIPTA